LAGWTGLVLFSVFNNFASNHFDLIKGWFKAKNLISKLFGHIEIIFFNFSTRTRKVMPECLPDKNIRVQVYRASMIVDKMDSR
jgi:hypothetical protein